MDCVIYMRWSSAEQGKGSTLERQRVDCRRHASESGWKVVDELIDDGVSAFKGRHALAGRLSQFVRDVEEGRYPQGVVLLCEKLDRLSREAPAKVFVWMMHLTGLGVTIATVEGSRTYSSGGLDMAAIIEVIVKAQLSHEESDKKSQRLGAAWASKRRRLASGEVFVMTRRAPAWLAVVGSPPTFVPIPERAEVVRRIFEETIAGYGKASIAKRLNLDGVPTFGRAKAWHASYVQKILRNNAVVGEFQPSRKPRGGERETAGDVVLDYFPSVIDSDLHRRAMSAMAERSRLHGGRGRRLVNLFAGLARCGACESRMTFRGKGRKERADGTVVNEDYLVCDGYQRGLGCDASTHWNYALWEKGILDPIIFEAVSELTFAPRSDVQALEIEVAAIERNWVLACARTATALEIAIETGRSDAKNAWTGLAARSDALSSELDDARERLVRVRGAPSLEEQRSRVRELRMSLNDEDDDIRYEARSKVMAAIHALVDRLEFNEYPTGVEMIVAGERIVSVDYVEDRGDTQWTMGRIDGQPFS